MYPTQACAQYTPLVYTYPTRAAQSWRKCVPPWLCTPRRFRGYLSLNGIECDIIESLDMNIAIVHENELREITEKYAICVVIFIDLCVCLMYF